jgi:methanethiol S-methyltransferase
MQRKLFFAYGVACHALFLAVYAYLACFVGGFLVPKTIDAPASIPLPAAVTINLALLVAFGLQHSIMARPTFKNWWTRFIAQPVERSTYVLASNFMLIAMFILWQPIDIVVWDVEAPLGRAVMWTLFAAGWLMVPAVTLLINHFDLFGTRQVWLHLSGRPYEHLPFRKPLAYKHVRHPLYVGWIIAFWATPTMTLGHLLFAAAMTAYIMIAVYFEERNLVQHFGEQHAQYRREVPMLVPRLRRTAGTELARPSATA